MKILFLSTNIGGGATVAAERQAVALRCIGHTVKHMVVSQNWNASFCRIEELEESVFISAPMHEFLKTDLIFQSYLENNRTGLSNTYMSLWRSTSPFDNCILEYVLDNDFDIVHCHWVANMVSSHLLKRLKKSNVKVLMTGHDMNHFTGACHYDAGCGQFDSGCEMCPQIKVNSAELPSSSMKEKISTYLEVKPHFIFPSDWLNSEYKKSDVGSSLGINTSSIIRNCIDTEDYTPAGDPQKLEIRSKFKFLADEILIVSGAENNNELRKGFRYFEHAFKTLNQRLYGSNIDKNITFVAFGGGSHTLEPSHPTIKYKHMGVLKSDEVRDLFKVSNLLAFTSVEENFANVILESLMCGSPVLGFNVGGIPDIVEHGVNGELVSIISETEFSNAMVNLIINHELIELNRKTLEWREKSFRNYSFNNIAKQLTSLYSQVLQGPVNE